MSVKAKTAVSFRQLSADLDEMLAFYAQHKPEVSRIFLYADDFDALTEHSESAKRYGFRFEGGVIIYRNYRLERTP